MVRPAFENLPVEAWLHAGRLGSAAQRSLCLFHDDPARGAPLLAALDELERDALPARRTVTLRRSDRRRGVRTLKLLRVPPRDDLRVLHVAVDGETATIETTDEGLPLLRDAFAAWLAGGEDFCVSPEHSPRRRKDLGRLDRESAEVWFWGPTYAGP